MTPMTDEPLWHWTEAGRPADPGSWDHLLARVTAAAVGPADRVWTAGMADWTPAAAVPALAAHVAADPLGYYSAPVGRLPPRATETLRRYAQPTGDAADWPLNDARLDELAEAARVRRRLTLAAGCYRLAGWAFGIFGGYGAVSELVAARRRRPPIAGTDLFYSLLTVAFVAGVAALLGFAAAATRRGRRWGAIVMLVLCLPSTLAWMVALIVAWIGPRSARGDLIGFSIFAVLFGGLSIVSARATAAATAFRRQPAWCQEALVRVERRR